MATIDQFERTLLQFDLAFTSLSREKTFALENVA